MCRLKIYNNVRVGIFCDLNYILSIIELCHDVNTELLQERAIHIFFLISSLRSPKTPPILGVAPSQFLVGILNETSLLCLATVSLTVVVNVLVSVEGCVGVTASGVVFCEMIGAGKLVQNSLCRSMLFIQSPMKIDLQKTSNVID